MPEHVSAEVVWVNGKMIWTSVCKLVLNFYLWISIPFILPNHTVFCAPFQFSTEIFENKEKHAKLNTLPHAPANVMSTMHNVFPLTFVVYNICLTISYNMFRWLLKWCEKRNLECVAEAALLTSENIVQMCKEPFWGNQKLHMFFGAHHFDMHQKLPLPQSLLVVVIQVECPHVEDWICMCGSLPEWHIGPKKGYLYIAYIVLCVYLSVNVLICLLL